MVQSDVRVSAPRVPIIERLERAFATALKAVSGLLIASMLLVLLMAVIGRKIGVSFSWYDEVAAILLAWLTYIGAALVALHRGHIGMGNIVDATGGTLRAALLVVRAVIISIFFLTLAWHGYKVMEAMSGFALITVPWMPVAVTQSIIPIGSVLFILAEVLATRRALLAIEPLGKSEEVPA